MEIGGASNVPGLFAGRVALVTGASHGIGAATARLLGSMDAAVAVNYRDDGTAAAAVVGDISAVGGRAVAVQADVTSAEDVDRLAEEVTAALGSADVLILNAAGLGRPAQAGFLEMPEDVLEGAVLAQLRAVLLPARVFGAAMAAAGAGSIVVVSCGLARYPPPGFIDLAVAKAAVEGAARALAAELGPFGVRVNIVAAGPTLTRATGWANSQVRHAWAEHSPLGRNAHPGDIAGAIALMASPLAGFCSGTYLPVNGGAIMP